MRYLSGEIERLLREERKMAFIAGPRQVGKTTLARRLLREAAQGGNYFNWDVESHRRAILARPEGFWAVAPAGRRTRVALDEIHKYPRWKRFLKGIYDAAGRETEIIVTGSGRLDVYQRGGDSLFGRYGLYRLHPFTLGELLSPDGAGVREPEVLWREAIEPAAPGTARALADLERFTGFPEPLFAASESRLRRWRRARRHLILREDLRDLTRIRDIGLVESLAALLPERVGSPLSLNALSEDLGVAFGTVRAWMETLARLYYVFEIRPYAGRLARALRREAKIYLFDYSEVADPGARFENMVAVHLRKLVDAWNDWGVGDFEIHYVRDKEKREADFLIAESRRPFLLIETKLSAREPSSSLRYFHERLRPAHAALLSREEPARGPSSIGGIRAIGAARFLSRI